MFDKLVELLIDSIKLFRLFVTIHAFEAGVVLRFGKFHRVVGPGLVWIWPFDVDEVYFAPTHILTMVIGPQSLTTKDGKQVVVSTMITHFVKDPKLYLLTIQGSESAVEDTAYGVVAKFVMDRSWDDLMHEDLTKELTQKMRQRADDYGVSVKQAQIIDLTPSRSIRLIQHSPARAVDISRQG